MTELLSLTTATSSSDQSMLPVFNSNSIITQLHHIDGLSEHYLYLNDDMFFGRDVRPDFFWLPSGIAKVFPSRQRRPYAPIGPDTPPHLNITTNIRHLMESCVRAICVNGDPPHSVPPAPQRQLRNRRALSGGRGKDRSTALPSSYRHCARPAVSLLRAGDRSSGRLLNFLRLCQYWIGRVAPAAAPNPHPAPSQRILSQRCPGTWCTTDSERAGDFIPGTLLSVGLRVRDQHLIKANLRKQFNSRCDS